MVACKDITGVAHRHEEHREASRADTQQERREREGQAERGTQNKSGKEGRGGPTCSFGVKFLLIKSALPGPWSAKVAVGSMSTPTPAIGTPRRSRGGQGRFDGRVRASQHNPR